MTAEEKKEQENKENRQNTKIIELDRIGYAISDVTRTIGEGIIQIEEGLENFIEKNSAEYINSEAVKKVIEDCTGIAQDASETVEGVAEAVVSIISDSL
ncbi:MAG: hypothetical protein E4G94_01425 [ANME-2 cluster archaeon]|jgi:hypothetical protein|nr:MAG: hypothetical protein E4G94_01425 [ANME-2 cluster archaeon]